MLSRMASRTTLTTMQQSNSRLSGQITFKFRETPGDVSDPESMNEILTNSGETHVSMTEDIVIAAKETIGRERRVSKSQDTPEQTTKKQKQKGKKKKRFKGDSNRIKTASASADVLDRSSGSSVVSQLTYVEGMDTATGLGLGYRISTTVTEKTTSKGDRTSKLVI
ncbi:uncharacterized protein LOC142335487 isoform X2 [Convolutriloba macropyga]|uniref:uncharacterized protein LOC142335487 isoform X2 n=1 Tax=Convolutriloba macropyga TaxID=536237 RepID=UPI003F52233C